MTNDLPLARQAIFRTVQGEGALAGLPMVFVRLAGCSINCDNCDTDYRLDSRQTLEQMRETVRRLTYGGLEWLWITGGEPADHDLRSLCSVARDLGLKVAVATAGETPSPRGLLAQGADFLSVSPHTAGEKWVQRTGEQVNLVPGLNGLKLADFERVDFSGFTHRYVTPLADREGRPTNVRECLDWVNCRPGWRMGCQSHKHWGIP